MKLTNYLRDAFIKAAMDDVPKVDYDDQGRKLLLDAVVAKLPPKVRAVWDDASLRGYLRTQHVFEHGFGVAVPIPDRNITLDARTRAKLDELRAAEKAQDSQRTALERKLRAAAYGCTTRKALAELLPEFAQYLPAEEATTRTLPAVANLVSDFVAAGWPKGKAKPKLATVKGAAA